MKIELGQEFEEALRSTIRRILTEEMHKMMPMHYTKKEACRMIGISYATLQNLIFEGILHTNRTGKIPLSEITRYINTLKEQ